VFARATPDKLAGYRGAMNRYLILIGAVLVAGVLAATSAGGPPPQIPVYVGATKTQPIAGHEFVALTVTPGAKRVSSVDCSAWIGSKNLVVHEQRFYSSQEDGAAAVTCWLKIPAKARGTLHVGVNGLSHYSGRIRHRP
jgi:hypothetical protein